jgi:hypothetical protein
VTWKCEVLRGHECRLGPFESVDGTVLLIVLAGNLISSHELLISSHKNERGQLATDCLISFGIVGFWSSLW